MSKLNCTRNGCKDVFNAFLVSVAYYAGLFEFPVIAPTYWIPNRLIPFSKALREKDHNQWIHFYEDDYLFERVWRNPKRYLPLFKRFNGVIFPDFSVYRDMPFAMQVWNIYRSRAIGSWLQRNGINVIVNIRYGDYRTFKCCCDGISKGCTIAVGSHGVLKQKVDRQIFVDGLDVVVRRLKPTSIVVYGSAPDSIFEKYRSQGIRVIAFESDFSRTHRGDR